MNESPIHIPTKERIEELGLTPKKTEVFLRRLEISKTLTPGQKILFEYRGGIRLGKVQVVRGTSEEPSFLLSEVEGVAGQTTLSIDWYHVSALFSPERSGRYEVGELVWWNNGDGIQEGKIEEIIPMRDNLGRYKFRVRPKQSEAKLLPDYVILGRAFDSAKRFNPYLGRDL